MAGPGPCYFFDQPAGEARPKRTRRRRGTGQVPSLPELGPEDAETMMVPPESRTRPVEQRRLAASDTLAQLASLLELHSGRGEDVFPAGLVNILDFTWAELTENVSHTQPRGEASSRGTKARAWKASPATPSKTSKHKTRTERGTGPVTHLLSCSAPLDVLKEPPDANGQKASTTIGFSMSSKACEEQGWIIQPPESPVWDPGWTSTCQWAVERLHLAQEQMKGPTEVPVLRHYGDLEKNISRRSSSGVGLLDLRGGFPEIPVTMTMMDDPTLQKLHLRATDGSSLIYYPSGRVAVCQSRSGLDRGGFYTNVFSDDPRASVLASLTPSGHGSVTRPHSSAVAAVWDQNGGMTCDPDGTVTKEWTWSSHHAPAKKMVLQVTEDVSVTLRSPASACLLFRAQEEKVRLPLPLQSTAAHTLSGQQKSDDKNLGECPEDTSQVHRRGRPWLELARLQKRARDIVEHWRGHYLVATGVCKPDGHWMEKRPTQLKVKPDVQSAAVSILNPADTSPGHLEDIKDAPNIMTGDLPAPISHVQKLSPKRPRVVTPRWFVKEDLQHVTEAGALRVHSNIRLELVETPVHPAVQKAAVPAGPSSSGPCPVLLRASLLGERSHHSCRCSSRHVPLLTDVEFDAFIEGQGPQSDQILVVCVTSAPHRRSPSPASMGSAVDQMHRKMNRNRSMPCSQMYLRGKLLFANSIFNGFSRSFKDLQKQVVKTREDFHRGKFLPPGFKFSSRTGSAADEDRQSHAGRGQRNAGQEES
ncbi:uncharacterized protein C3orf20-like isoform X2 [Denticeps clupeoides]|uniref:uncharacterized protein C3orf20-like isoform X2 n=1 Tax=Denticeps clupeoides TaxID=299321 RepID=UPI0010A5832E|nr:uncharacterized protein C3orf20-like isoform X2 [Denticeps clupeoides]